MAPPDSYHACAHTGGGGVGGGEGARRRRHARGTPHGTHTQRTHLRDEVGEARDDDGHDDGVEDEGDGELGEHGQFVLVARAVALVLGEDAVDHLDEPVEADDDSGEAGGDDGARDRFEPFVLVSVLVGMGS